MISWSTATPIGSRSGHATSRAAAWLQAIAAGIELATETRADHPIDMTVSSETASLYPGFDERGRLDLAATRAAAARLIADLVARDR